MKDLAYREGVTSHTPIELLDLPANVQEILLDAGFYAVGQLEDLRARWTSIKGIGAQAERAMECAIWQMTEADEETKG